MSDESDGQTLHAVASWVSCARLPVAALADRIGTLKLAADEHATAHSALYETVWDCVDQATKLLRTAERTLMAGVPYLACGCIAGTHGTAISEIQEHHRGENPWTIQAAMIAASKADARREPDDG